MLRTLSRPLCWVFCLIPIPAYSDQPAISSLANSHPDYLALRNATPGQSFSVNAVTLTRDVGAFHLTSGTVTFLEPVLAHPHHFTSGTGTKLGLALVAVVAALGGIAFAIRAWLQARIPTDKLEPALLENVFYVDSTISNFVGGPGTKAFEAAATADRRLVDGAVNGVARLVRMLGEAVRPLQSGYLRHYASGVAVGAIILVVWLALRGVS